jgi:hypothetical protein
MQDRYEANMEEVTSNLRATSSKAISDTITEICNAIQEGRECKLDKDWDPTLLTLAHQQTRAGQRVFIRSLWPLAWSEHSPTRIQHQNSKHKMSLSMDVTDDNKNTGCTIQNVVQVQ